jgi:hypothetical protein
VQECVSQQGRVNESHTSLKRALLFFLREVPEESIDDAEGTEQSKMGAVGTEEGGNVFEPVFSLLTKNLYVE